MQVTETLNQGLKRELKVVVPAADLEQSLSQRLAELSGRAQIRGFRPGKVPVSHLRRVYGKSVMAEVVQKTVEDSSRQALADKNLKPAYQPEIALPEEQAEVEGVIEGKSDLAYTMKFEVVPPVEVQDFSGLELERMVAETEDNQVTEAMDRLLQRFKDFEPREEGAKAEKGDRVTISFKGSIDGTPFEGGEGTDVPLELGSGSFIPGFENQLVGAKAGDELTIKATFPEQYQVQHLAGKEAEFAVKVSAVAAPKQAAADEEFAKRLGFESIDKLSEMLKARLDEETSGMSRMKLKRDVLDALDKSYSFELPERLVDAEFNQIWNQLTGEMQRQRQTFEQENTTEGAAREEYRKIAERRVRLGLVLGTIGEKAGINVTDEELERALVERARQFPGQERQVYEFYRKNPNATMELRGPIFEQKVVDHIVSGAKVTDRKVSREELSKALEDEDGHVHDHGHAHAHDHHGHDHDHAHHHDHDHSHDHGHAHDHDHSHDHEGAGGEKDGKSKEA